MLTRPFEGFWFHHYFTLLVRVAPCFLCFACRYNASRVWFRVLITIIATFIRGWFKSIKFRAVVSIKRIIIHLFSNHIFSIVIFYEIQILISPHDDVKNFKNLNFIRTKSFMNIKTSFLLKNVKGVSVGFNKNELSDVWIIS